ncbi:MAG: sulfatase family protein [Planctomycetota bacterium]|jgi:uncharacterized sulfatase
MKKLNSRRQFLKSAGLFTMTLLTTSCTEIAGISKKSSKKANIIIFLSDDHGYYDTGCYGNKVVRTPNIDKLADEGLKFNLALTPTAMCSPSRSAMYTGLYPHRNGCHKNHSSIKPGVKTLPDYLKPLNYRVALAGKRHIKPIKQFGFEYMGLNFGQIKNFMKSCTDNPFCLIMTPPLPHAPAGGYTKGTTYDPKEIPLPIYLVDTPELRQCRSHYYDLITKTDDMFGKTMDIVENLNLKDDTMLIYTSDHGAGFQFEKWTCYDGGLKVPFVVRWPGVVKASTQTDAMISFVDVVPTLIEIAGGTVPDDLDGKSFLDVLKGKTNEHHEFIFGTHTTEGIKEGRIYPIRSVRTKTYKYIRNLNPDGKFTNLITERPRAGWASWKEVAKHDSFAARQVRFYQKRGAEELYYICTRPYEIYNIAEIPFHEEVKNSLSKKLDEWMKQQGDRGLEAELDDKE